MTDASFGLIAAWRPDNVTGATVTSLPFWTIFHVACGGILCEIIWISHNSEQMDRLICDI